MPSLHIIFDLQIIVIKITDNHSIKNNLSPTSILRRREKPGNKKLTFCMMDDSWFCVKKS